MPTYEYRCKSCDHHFDIVQAFSDDALTECPSCHRETLKKVFGNVGISFKGSGFYKTDSRSSGSSSTSSSDTSSGGTGSDSSSGSTSSSSSDASSSSSSGSEKSSSGDKKATTPASSS